MQHKYPAEAHMVLDREPEADEYNADKPDRMSSLLPRFVLRGEVQRVVASVYEQIWGRACLIKLLLHFLEHFAFLPVEFHGKECD